MNQQSRSNQFTQAKVQQHKQLTYQLQRANTIAAQAMIKLDRLSPSHSDCAPVCRELANVVDSICLLTACCERILDNNRPPTYDRINVIFGKVCEYCLANERRGSDHEDRGDRLEANPAWRLQVETLLSLTTLAMCRVLGWQSLSSRQMKKHLQSLADLSQALSQQQQHLDEIGSWRRTKIEVIYEDGRRVCRKCGHPFESGMDQEQESIVT